MMALRIQSPHLVQQSLGWINWKARYCWRLSHASVRKGSKADVGASGGGGNASFVLSMVQCRPDEPGLLMGSRGPGLRFAEPCPANDRGDHWGSLVTGPLPIRSRSLPTRATTSSSREGGDRAISPGAAPGKGCGTMPSRGRRKMKQYGSGKTGVLQPPVHALIHTRSRAIRARSIIRSTGGQRVDGSTRADTRRISRPLATGGRQAGSSAGRFSRRFPQSVTLPVCTQVTGFVEEKRSAAG